MNEQHWSPSRLFDGDAQRYAVILLNQPILPAHHSSFQKLWSQATLRICADGGANRLYDAFFASNSASTSTSGPSSSSLAAPHDVIGDLDSLRPDVRTFFEKECKTKVQHVASQYSTDLQKCILRVEQFEDEKEESQELDVVLVGGLSGRLDQTMHTIHVLCQLSPLESTGNVQDASKYRGSQPQKYRKMARAAEGEVRAGETEEDDFVTLRKRKTTYVVSENSVAWILAKGDHLIDLDAGVDKSQSQKHHFGPTCGLLPFEVQLEAADTAASTKTTRGAVIKTQGLEWDLDGTPSAVGGFLSTSNHVVRGQQIHVQTDRAIIWTVELKADESALPSVNG